MAPVEFDKPWRGYQPGDRIQLAPAVKARLLGAGIVQELEPEQPAKTRKAKA